MQRPVYEDDLPPLKRMQSYLIFSCYHTFFLLKKVKLLGIKPLEKLEIDASEQ